MSASASAKTSRPNLLLFGIDFGTTYTGVAWAWSRKPDDIHIITKWESELYQNSDREKSPTTIHYGDNANSTTWGYGVPLHAEPLQWFKLLLLHDDDLPDHLRRSPHIQRAKQMLAGQGKTAVEVITDYLGLVWNHVLENVTRTLGTTAINRTPFHVVITVPAIWKGYACAKMSEAASKAGILSERSCGITTLGFISEPESAARATLSDMDGRPDLERGDGITVVDCGGGTVDIISYKIENPDRMSVSECVEGQGGLCGATFVDQCFEDLLKKVIGRNAWAKLSKSGIRKMMNQSWEHGIKQQFDGRPKEWPVDLPYRCDGTIQTSGLELKHSQVTEVFDAVIPQIEELVSQQVRQVKKKLGYSPKYVILVGGFGRCKYLYKRLVTLVGDKSEVLQADGTGPWTAVCRGAVISAITSQGFSIERPVDVVSRISRANYGIKVNPKFVEGKHDIQDRYWDDLNCFYKARHQMDWYLRKGESTCDKAPVKMSYRHSYFSDDPGAYPRNSVMLYTCEDGSPPLRLTGSVKKLCRVVFDAPDAFEQLPEHTNANGRLVRQFRFQVEMRSYGSSVEFEVLAGAKKLATHNVAVVFEEPELRDDPLISPPVLARWRPPTPPLSPEGKKSVSRAGTGKKVTARSGSTTLRNGPRLGSSSTASSRSPAKATSPNSVAKKARGASGE